MNSQNMHNAINYLFRELKWAVYDIFPDIFVDSEENALYSSETLAYALAISISTALGNSYGE